MGYSPEQAVEIIEAVLPIGEPTPSKWWLLLIALAPAMFTAFVTWLYGMRKKK